MLKKRKVRELAMQVLFLWDTHGEGDSSMARQLLEDGTDDAEVRRSSLDMAQATWEQRDSIDRWVEKVAPQWPPRRQPGVDRNLLRLAVWELTNTTTPPKVVLDEAIELAKQFSTEQSASFVNAVLDSVLKEHAAMIAENPVPQDCAPTPQRSASEAADEPGELSA